MRQVEQARRPASDRARQNLRNGPLINSCQFGRRFLRSNNVMKSLLIALLTATAVGAAVLAAPNTAEAGCARYCRHGPWLHNHWGYGGQIRGGWGLGGIADAPWVGGSIIGVMPYGPYPYGPYVTGPSP